MITIEKNLQDLFPPTIEKVRLFNFNDGETQINLAEVPRHQQIGTLENCWVRITDSAKRYYDFVATSVYFDNNSRGLFILASDDAEFISVDRIGQMVKAYLLELQAKGGDTRQFLDAYATNVLKEIRTATKELASLHSVAKLTRFSRLDIEDTYEYMRDKLVRRYLVNLIASKVIVENRDTVSTLVLAQNSKPGEV